MDANTMVQYAKKWTSVPVQVSCEVNLKTSGLVIMSCFSILYFNLLATKSFYILFQGLFESLLMPFTDPRD